MLPGGTYQYARSDDRETRKAGTAWMFYDEAFSETRPGVSAEPGGQPSAAQEDAAGQIEAAVLELIARLSDDKKVCQGHRRSRRQRQADAGQLGKRSGCWRAASQRHLEMQAMSDQFEKLRRMNCGRRWSR